MQSKAKYMRGSAANIKLHAGGGIKFGFMRQNNISGRTLSVTDVCSYVFDNDSFISYQLRDEDTDINMIIADGDRPSDAYLALSIALKDRWFSALFASTPPKEWFRLKAGDPVKVATDAAVIPQGWLVSNYKHVLTTYGRKIDGDYRQRKLSELTEHYADPFDYVLLVSEDGEHAIEVEKYENGTIKAYATVYRPLTDITETTQFHRPYIVTKNDTKTEAVILSETPAPEKVVSETFASTLMLVSKNPAEVTVTISEDSVTEITATVKPKPASEATITELVETALAEVKLDEAKPLPEVKPVVKPAEVKPVVKQPEVKPASNDDHPPAPAQPRVSKAQETMLPCDTKLVTHILKEAGHNKISLEDTIRKVLGLPAEINDKVYVPFALTEAEQAILSKRYGLDSVNMPAIQEKIIEELRQFAGLK